MKAYLLLLLLFSSMFSYTQVLEEFDSFDGVGEWVSPGGTSGSDAGELCFNIGSTYLANVWYIFESPIYDFSGYSEVNLMWSQEINLRSGDQLRLYYFDLADSSWYYFSLENLSNGLQFATIPNTANQITFDLLTTGSGNRSGKYAHIGFLDISNPTPLPVELLDFSATMQPRGVKLKWSTASEFNSDYFSVYRSTGGEWTKLADIPAAGFSNSIIEYEYVDDTVIYNTSYYRLKEVDVDGWKESWYPISVFRKPGDNGKLYNLSGQEVDENYKGLIIDGNKHLIFKQ